MDAAEGKGVREGVDLQGELVDVILVAGGGDDRELDKIVGPRFVNRPAEVVERPVRLRAEAGRLRTGFCRTGHRRHRVGGDGVGVAVGVKVDDHAGSFPFTGKPRKIMFV